MVSYEAFFFDEETNKLIHSLEPNKLAKQNDKTHLTFKYRPTEEQTFNELAGKEYEFLIVGYGNDGQNSGFSIQLPDELIEYYINYDEQNPQKLKTPHITTSLAQGATPMNTKNLTFLPIETPIKIKGKFGFWIKEDGKEYISYEPVPKTSQNNLNTNK